MWALKIKVRERWNIYNEKAAKFKLKILFYSQNHYETDSKLFLIASGIIQGDEKKRNQFISALKKDRRVESLEVNNDFFICIYSEPKTAQRVKAVKVAYSPEFIFIKPVIIDEKGWEEWEVASPKRNVLESLMNHAKTLKNTDYQFFYLKKQKISNLMIYSMIPKLTERQKKALALAVEFGYYGYPRKTTLEFLAKQMRLSVSTFQFHLAKAEAKLIPFLVKR